MTGSIELLLVIGLTGLLYLLRLDAQRFGVAEYDDSDRNGDWRSWLRRISWYGLGIALVLLVYWLYPSPVSVLHLDMGPDREQALIYGLAAGVGGIVLAFLFAWFRYGGFRLPAPGAYPGALLNSVGTAIVDEAVFRGILLGLLLHQGFSVPLAIAVQAIAYGAATRLWVKGRSKGMLFIDLVIAVVGAWLVIATATVTDGTVTAAGIGAAVIAHAITRFSVFLATGHAGQARQVGWEPEEVAGRALPPKGWDLAGEDTGSQAWMAPPSGPPGLGPSYAGQSPFAPLGYGAAQGYPGPVGWAPPPGMSSVPMSVPMGAPGQYPDAPWVVDPETGAWIPAQPSAAWDMPPEGWTPPPEGWTPPPEGWTPPPEGWTPPPEGWPQQGPPPEGWTPPPDGWSSPPEGWSGPPEGWQPPTEPDGQPHA